jgi:hypothetical protein
MQFNGKGWQDKFISDPLNDKAKQDFLDFMTKRNKYTLSELQRKRQKSKLTNIHHMQFNGKGWQWMWVELKMQLGKLIHVSTMVI